MNFENRAALLEVNGKENYSGIASPMEKVTKIVDILLRELILQYNSKLILSLHF